ncbi:MAG: leucyl/phenylalanyl-tRNA--protein transferase [Magnetococcales bacterium]|nr:leucyl/phenylalanyl-tRNA--protein transferase [Magnetococcales bacterium]
MPVYALPKEAIFPPVSEAEPNGLLAVGGDLSVERLLAAYGAGIFPWFSEGDPYLWWSPDPRLILTPQALHLSRSLKKTLRKNPFVITFDCAFNQVVRQCAEAKRGPEQEGGTWITEEMIAAYTTLHRMGYAHSVEAWVLEGIKPILVGGTYGIAWWGCFFGESMFHLRPDASKVAFVCLVENLRQRGIRLIDCQMKTDHLLRFGAWEVPRSEFIQRMQQQRQQVRIIPGFWR